MLSTFISVCMFIGVFFYYASERPLTALGLFQSFGDTARIFLIIYGVQHLFHCLGGR